MSSNRNPIKQWFITFPQSDKNTKINFLYSLFDKDNIENGIAVEEKHADGNPHLHLAIKLKKGISKSKLLEIITREYPNDFKRIKIEAIRNLSKSYAYLTIPDKEKYVDNEPYFIGPNILEGAKDKT